jgi:hypothetical protein
MSTETDTSGDHSDGRHVIHFQALQALIGGIVLLLLPVVYFGNWIIFTRHVGGCLSPTNPRIPGSLSGYYYTHMRNLFVGAMCAVGVYFVAYRGYKKKDYWFTNVAGAAAILIALFPTMPPSYKPSGNGANLYFSRWNVCGPVTRITFHQSAGQSNIRWVHVGSLVLLFLMVFLMVLVQFTKTDKPKGTPSAHGGRLARWLHSLFSVEPREKLWRNIAYVICAGGIALSAVLAVVQLLPAVGKLAPWLLFAELGAFTFFGIAWYIKGAASAHVTHHPHPLVQVLALPVRWLADPRETAAQGAVAPATPSPEIPPGTGGS